MKRSLSGLIALIILSVVITPGRSLGQGESGNLGVGLLIGEPTGISLKYWSSETNAWGGGVAWSLGRYDAIHLHADYLWHNYSVFQDIEKGRLPLYYGVGGRIVFAEDNSVLGVRVPVGLNYIFEDDPLDLFLELVPTVNLAPDTDFDIDGALGIRIYF